MLGKLVKYDIKNIGRQTGYEYIILAVLLLLYLIAKQLYSHFSSTPAVYLFYSGTHVALYVGMAIVCILLVTTTIQYYFRNLFKDEGYLMHTLPVSGGSLMASKIVATLFWSVVMASACYLCEAVVSKNLFWAGDMISSFCKGQKGWEMLVAGVLVYAAAFYINVLCGIFMGAAIGYGFTGKYQGVCVFLLCILAYWVDQVSASVAVFFMSRDFLTAMQEQVVSLGMAGKVILEWAAVHLILAGLYNYVAVKWMKTHLNLD